MMMRAHDLFPHLRPLAVPPTYLIDDSSGTLYLYISGEQQNANCLLATQSGGSGTVLLESSSTCSGRYGSCGTESYAQQFAFVPYDLDALNASGITLPEGDFWFSVQNRAFPGLCLASSGVLGQNLPATLVPCDVSDPQQAFQTVAQYTATPALPLGEPSPAGASERSNPVRPPSLRPPLFEQSHSNASFPLYHCMIDPPPCCYQAHPARSLLRTPTS